jgi:serine/threonine-protein kinase
LLVGHLIEGRYRVGPRIARGGMSTVYRGVDERLDRQVAIKVMSAALSADPAFVDRFAREARAAAKLSHLNAVSVYDQGIDSGPAGHFVFLVMELVSGRTLRDLIRERGRLSPATAVSVLEPVLGALAAAHRAGLVHRDVKPENILLADDGVVKVADFGLARAVETDAAATRTGLMMGTVAYCSPEQISRGRTDQRSDVYSAGIVLFELLTGETPYVGESAMAVAYQHVHSRVPAPSQRAGEPLPRQLDDLVQRATDSDPAGRPLDAGAFLAEVHDVRADLGLPVVGVPPRPRPEPTTRPGPRHPVPSPAARGTAPARYRRPEPAPLPDGATPTTPLQLDFNPGDTRIVDGVGVDGQPTIAGLQPGARPPALPPHAAPPHAAPPNAGPSNAGPPNAGGPAAAGTTRSRRRRRGLLVLLIVVLLGAALGYGGWWFAEGRYRHVPAVNGQGRSNAIAEMRAAGFDHVDVRTQYSETAARDTVISSAPSGGGRSLPKQTVTLVVSAGKERFTVPDVHGTDEADARAALGKIPVQLVTSQQSNDTVPKGTVIGTQPAQGSAVKRDQAVTILISSGPPILSVPSVSGQSQDDATAALTAAGFQVNVQTAFSDTVPQGQVISQSPNGSDQAVKGSGVTLTVSQGPQLITIPSIKPGSNADDATDQLEALGLTVKRHEEFGAPLNIVVALDPTAGTQVLPGDTVNLYVD